jgi:hypothetical protein
MIYGSVAAPGGSGMAGGRFSLSGGIAGLIGLVQSPGAPMLHIGSSPMGLVVFWERPAHGFILEETPFLQEPLEATTWTRVTLEYQTNATHVLVPVTTDSGQRFYRLRRP